MAKMMKPRLISAEQAKIVAATGGVIGVWTHLADTAKQFAENIKALADVVGADHVAIGTDTKMTPAYRSPNDKWQGPGPGVGEKKEGEGNSGNKRDTALHDQNNGPKGPGGDRKQSGEGTNGIWQQDKQGFYYTVVEALLNAGFNEDEIGKIGGGNYCRIFNAATKGY